MSEMPPLPLPRAFPAMRGLPPDPNRRNLGTSGTWSIPEPSPSLNAAILGEVSEKDRTRQAGFAAVGHAEVVAKAMAAAARSAHSDPDLSTVARHRRAAELAAKAVLPFVGTMETATAAYTKEITALNEKLSGPPADAATENDMMRALTKFAGLPPHQRFSEVRKNIDAGSDLLVLVMTRSDKFLIEGLLSETEHDVMMQTWRKARFPDEAARLHRLEMDLEAIGNTSRILESYQRQCANQAIVAEGLQPSPAMRGAVGPMPVNRGRK